MDSTLQGWHTAHVQANQQSGQDDEARQARPLPHDFVHPLVVPVQRKEIDKIMRNNITQSGQEDPLSESSADCRGEGAEETGCLLFCCTHLPWQKNPRITLGC